MHVLRGRNLRENVFTVRNPLKVREELQERGRIYGMRRESRVTPAGHLSRVSLQQTFTGTMSLCSVNPRVFFTPKGYPRICSLKTRLVSTNVSVVILHLARFIFLDRRSH